MRTKTKNVLGMLSAAFLVLALSGCIGEEPTGERTFIVDNLTNPCNNEVVNISGTYNITGNENYIYVKFHGTGVGNQTNKYVFNSAYNISADGGAIDIEVISKGKAPNFLVKIKIHNDENDDLIIDRAETVCTKPHVVVPIFPTSEPTPPP